MSQPVSAAGRPAARSTEPTVASVLEDRRSDGRAALVGYLPVGYPTVPASVQALVAAAAAGVDVLEIGVPYSDPLMDGPVIADAVGSALRAGVRVADAFHAAETVRAAHPHVAVLLMTYWNPVLQHGVDRFARHARDAGVAGLITPDLLPDDADEWLAASAAHGLERVFLVAPSSTDERLRLAARESTGFVYAASTMGVTGARDTVAPTARRLVDRARAAGASRVCLGLGVSTAAQAAEVGGYADGVIVGSALVRALADGGTQLLATTVRDLARGVSGGPAEHARSSPTI